MDIAFGTLTTYHFPPLSLFRNIFTDNRHLSDSPVYSAQHQVLNAMFSKSWKPGENIAITVARKK